MRFERTINHLRQLKSYTSAFLCQFLQKNIPYNPFCHSGPKNIWTLQWVVDYDFTDFNFSKCVILLFEHKHIISKDVMLKVQGKGRRFTEITF